MNTKRRTLFLCSLFFVIGFAAVFSAVGILLQTVLSAVAPSVQAWLARLGGAIVILFGLFLLGLIRIPFLEKDHRVAVKRKFASRYVTSFVFGAAFALGWSPCVGAALGAILALAATEPQSAFLLLFAYTMGIGAPFLLVGLFADTAASLIDRSGRFLVWFKYVFGTFLIITGILMFVGQLGILANFQILTSILSGLSLVTNAGGGIASFSFGALLISFLAGVGSFLSPCILPIVPGFISYLATVGSSVDPSNDPPRS